MIRPHVQAQSVQYEQAKFKEFLEIQEGIVRNDSFLFLTHLCVIVNLTLNNQNLYFVDGLATTRAWLIPHIDKSVAKPTESDPLFLRNTSSQTLAKAYLELLEWNKDKPYPEVYYFHQHFDNNS